MIAVHVAASSAVTRAGLESVVRSAEGLAVASVDSTDALEPHLDAFSSDALLVAIPHLTEEWIALLGSAAVPAVVLTDLPDTAALSPAPRGGIRAVLSSDASLAEIAAALTAAAAGLITFQSALLDSLLESINREEPRVGGVIGDPLDDPLTPREVEVLTLLAEGHTNKLIARSLGISEHTVKFHVTAIMNKLQAASRTDAVMQAIRRGLIMI